MFTRTGTYSYFALLALVLLLTSACTSLREIDREIGRFISGELLGEKPLEAETDPAPGMASSTPLLSKEQKEMIDRWLEQNGLNRFGDQKEAFYASGTPLFDTLSGEMRERYEYILEKHPDILTKI